MKFYSQNELVLLCKELGRSHSTIATAMKVCNQFLGFDEQNEGITQSINQSINTEQRDRESGWSVRAHAWCVCVCVCVMSVLFLF